MPDENLFMDSLLRNMTSITDTMHSSDKVGVAAQFLTNPSDVDVYGTVCHLNARSPDRTRNCFAGYDFSAMSEKMDEDLKFLSREGERGLTIRYCVLRYANLKSFE